MSEHVPAVTSDDLGGFKLACPVCQGSVAYQEDAVTCVDCRSRFREVAGIWDFLPRDRSAAFAKFLQDYQAVRAAEGWGSAAPDYYRALPFFDSTNPQREIWRRRAESYRLFCDRVLAPLATRSPRPLQIVDLGAGNCWLSHRLAALGHLVAAVDLSTSDVDGLGAYLRYGDGKVSLVRAELDRIPFAAGQADLAIFNASLHYSADIATTLREALRVLKSDGWLVVMDSPVYRDASSGETMVRERAEHVRRELGITLRHEGSAGFLTWAGLARMARDLGFGWRVLLPIPPWRQLIRAAKTKLRRQREPAQFPLLVGTRPGPAARPVAGRAGFRSVLPLPIARLLVRWRYRLFQRHRHRRLVIEQVGPWSIVVLPDVFNPKLFRTGEFLASSLDASLVAPGARVLDLGSGSGIGAISASRWAERVTAVDINPAAVRCTRINLLLNHADDRVEVYQGDLFAPIGEKRFDVVLFNPPFFRGAPTDLFDHAWRAVDVVERFAGELADHLTPTGKALVVLSSDGDTAAFLAAFERNGLVASIVTTRRFLNETLTIYCLQPVRGGP